MKKILLFTGMFAMTSCAKQLEYPEYFNFFNQFQKGSYIELRENGYVYQLQVRTPEFCVLNDLRESPKLDSKVFYDSLKNYNYGNLFCMRIWREDKLNMLSITDESEEDYYRKVEYLSSSFENRIVAYSKDTLSCDFHHFERTFSITPYVQLLFSFGNGAEMKDINDLIFEDTEFSKTTLRFENISEYQKDLPEIKI